MSVVDPLFVSFQSALSGRYSLDRELGRGGSGIVYLAREVHLDRMVAIKLLPPERATDETLRERFLREARMAAKLSHPNIIPIHAVEDAGGFVFFVMAFVDGETLASRVRTRGPLTSTEGTRVIREVAWALAYAHGQGVVHRDVKPDNILIEMGTGRVLVADFGIASAAGDSAGGPVSGTPEFMSPEAVLGKEIDGRSDLYALGATAYFAFSGRLPFEGATATEVLARQVTDAPPPLTSLGLTVPRKLAVLVDRCLAKAPSDRPATADTLAEQLGVAVQQRRELPPALRAFVKRQSRLNGPGTIVGSVVIMPFASTVAAVIGTFELFGSTALVGLGGIFGLAVFAGGATLMPFAYLVSVARKLLRFGFAHADIEPAFKTEIEQEREERSLDASSKRTWFDAFAGPFVRVSAIMLLLINGFLVFLAGSGPTVLRYISPGPFVVGAMLSFFATIAGIAMLQSRRDVDTEFWARIWTGKIGKWAFSVAKKLAGRNTTVTAVTHRATELSLGLAAEQLFDGLPKETRRALAGLPDTLRRLQEDAQLLRKRHDEINDALSGSSPTSPEYAQTRALRDELHTKLGEAVGALETIRLNLLRLHAGSATVEGLTTHLGIAAEVAADVERLVAAHDSVNRTLKFPRTIAPSPA